jgi:hypothetical protein
MLRGLTHLSDLLSGPRDAASLKLASQIVGGLLEIQKEGSRDKA